MNENTEEVPREWLVKQRAKTLGISEEQAEKELGDSQNALTLDEFLNYHSSLPRGEFKPSAFYNEDGDQLEVYWENESSYAKQLQKMALMFGQESEKITGVKVYGIKQILKKQGLTIIPFYYKLLVTAPVGMEIWIGDEHGNFVQKEEHILDTSLRPGKYTVQFGLKEPQYPINLQDNLKISYEELTKQ